MFIVNRKSLDEGLTLIEILISLVIIGILAGVGFVGLGTARSNSVQNTCKTGYQALSLAVSAYQADNSGTMPPSVSALQPTYISPGLLASYGDSFSFQLGSFAVTSFALSSSIATVEITSTFTPPITVGETIQVTGVDSANLDGSWIVRSFSGSTGTYTITFNVISTSTITTTAISSAGAILNAVQSPTSQYDLYVYNLQGNVVGTTAPSACSLLQ